MEQLFIGKTVDDAKEQASQVFGVSKDEITFTVLEEPRKTLFGKLKGEAKVNAVYKVISKAQVAGNYIKGILKGLSENADIEITEGEESATIEIVGDTSGTIIGRRGETLDSLQYLASMVCNKSDKDYYRICVDSCGYRAKRKTTLEELAGKIAKTVIRTGRSSTLEPMNPYERRIIHSAISEIEGVASHSVGEEPFRKVVITSTKKPERREKRDFDKKDTDRRNFKNKDRPYTPSNKSIDFKTSFEKDYVKPVPKPKPEDTMDTELYGKINLD